MESIVVDKYRDLLEISDSLIVMNKSETILFISQESSKIFGIKRSQIEGKKISELFDNAEDLTKALVRKQYNVPIYLKARNILTGEITEMVVIFQLFQRTGVPVFDSFLEFILIASKVSDTNVEIKGVLGVSINFTKQMGGVFVNLHSSLSRGFGGGKFGAIMSAVVLLVILGLGGTYSLVKENSGLIKTLEKNEILENKGKITK